MKQLLAVLLLLIPLAVNAQAVVYAELKPAYFSTVEDGATFNDQIDDQQYEFKVVNRSSEKGVKVKVESSWKKHGAYHQFSSGTLKRITRYKLGKKDAKEEIYRSGTGILLKTTDWVDGKKDGIETRYHKNGSKSQEMSYAGHELHGAAHWYDPDGSLSTERHYKNNVQHGLMKHYDKGRLTHTQMFVNDKGGKTNWAK